MVSNATTLHRPGWTWLAAGILACVTGFMALFNPIAATLTAEQIAGWSFLVVGVMQGFDVLRIGGWVSRLLTLGLAVVFVLLGLALLAQPLHGVLALTVTVALLFLAGGVAKLLIGWRNRRLGLFWTALASGILSLLLGVFILANFPWSAVSVLGVLLAIELISSGATLITLWWAGRDGAAVPA